MSSSNRKTNFSSQRSAIPFGKFEAGSDDIFPCNESMVGREGARAKLIDFLTNAGTRKAILVTGRRGMGKTSFVNYCLKEYEEAKIERYWRSDIGRTLGAWLWLLVISLFCAAAFILGSSILKILLDNIINKHNYFLLIPFLPLTFGLSYPLLQGVKIFTVLFKNKSSIISANVLGNLSVIFVILIFLLIPNSGVPIVTLSRLLVMIASIYFIGELLDQCLITLKNKRVGWFIFSIFSAVIGCFSFYFEPINYLSTPLERSTFSNYFIASELLGLASINRFISLFKKPQHLKKIQISVALNKSKSWFFLIGLLFLILPFIFSDLPLTYIKNFCSTALINFEFNKSSAWGWLLLLCFFFTLIKLIFLKQEKNLMKKKI